MKFNIRFTIVTATLLSMTGIVKAQQKELLSFDEYLSMVGKKNLTYAAQKYNVSMAEASIQTANMFPDPQLDMEGSNNGVYKNMGYTYGSSLGWTLELGGKRRARVDLAKNQSELSRILLLDFFRNLRADASLGYVEALKSKALLDVQQDSYKNMLQLSKSDSIRYRLGTISLVTSKQSKLEAASLLNSVYQAESAEQQAITALYVFLSDNKLTGRDVDGDFNAFNRDFGIEDLLTQALNERADLLAAKQNTQVAKSQINLERANRKIDLGLTAGVSHNTTATNEIAPSPAVNAVKLGVSIPLKFSNNRNAGLKIAEMAHSQSQLEYQQVEQSIRAEVMQAYQQYIATQKQVKQFHNGMLTEAKNILDGIIYSYKRGESSILEVLNAQRTYNDVRKDYYQALADNATALIELERKTGIWDISF
ncbi:TolC family protein [Elizabethkingia anophelis]|uniref:TolC family protein n=1 Tax=Elizabethkingia anophelis TaxID=1117645 RepID=UPI001F3BFFB0|nr:TolC family protein [Elizabethkingia anophelis]MCL1648932.1 TolC family protein [Elizabethkingia anophelis]MCL1682085.1 TolC family protein [Elizabethkingia anophelis]WLJ07746.1 TolC family protein [Elizabethkingia anophelis]WMC05983.1 MAG: transporter [Elizabethkingia anophelis]WQI08226.1 TolC family protein [Elizabethkingia anophelis]